MFSFLKRRPLFYAALVLTVFLGGWFYFSSSSPIKDVGPATVRGTVVSQVREKYSQFGERRLDFLLKTKNHHLFKVFLKRADVVLRYGDSLEMSGRIADPRGARNPGGFDYRRYLWIQHIDSLFFSGKKDSVRMVGENEGNPFTAMLMQVRERLLAVLKRDFKPRHAGFLSALFLGEKSGIDDDFLDLFLKTGTIHILAVSGFNVGFLMVVIACLLMPLPLPAGLRYTITLLAIWFYCALVGWQAPIFRASVMATVLVASRLLGKKADLLNSLGVAAIVILLLRPRDVMDMGFQLSFLTVLGMALFVPRFTGKKEDILFLNHEKKGWAEKGSRYFSELFWVSFVALFVTLPITVQTFYLFTPLSLLANLIVVPLSFFLFFIGSLYLGLVLWVPIEIMVLIEPMKILMRFFVGSLEWCENFPGSSLIVGRLSWVLWTLLVSGTLYLFLTRRIASRWVRAFSIFIFVAMIFLAQEITRHGSRSFTMTMLDVGQGESIYFEFPHGGNLLVDAGKGGDSDSGRRHVAPFLKSKGVRVIDAVVISHPQEDHIGGLLHLFREFKIRRVFDSQREYSSKLYARVRSAIAQEGANYEKTGRGDQSNFYRDVSVRFLGPALDAEPSANINDDSLVMRVSYGQTDILLTGDIQEKGMRALLESDESLDAEILKVPHHGGKMHPLVGEAFLKAVSPQASLVSAGERNPFGHPKPETLAILSAVPQNHIYRTDREGAVQILIDEKSFKVVSYRPLDGS